MRGEAKEFKEFQSSLGNLNESIGSETQEGLARLHLWISDNVEKLLGELGKGIEKGEWGESLDTVLEKVKDYCKNIEREEKNGKVPKGKK